MSEMSSFYGGRTGASFVIAKRFDGIDIPQPGDGSGVTEYSYTRGVYAANAQGEFILSDEPTDTAVTNGTTTKYLITRNSENFSSKEYNWIGHENDGTAINSTEYKFPRVLAEGMIQCFEKGSKTASLVNYGEYVMIDTMMNLYAVNNPDNGKIFRRGMDLTNDYAGGEYIGQVQGPQGEAMEFNLAGYKEALAATPHREASYNVKDESIVPGSYLNEDGEREFEDEIKYAWATVRDAWGNVEDCLIGFKFPTLVQEFEARSITPYTNRAGEHGGYYNTDLIVEDSEQYDAETGKWQHPFYQKWQIKVPHGYHGINSTNIEVVPTKTRAAYVVNGVEAFEGATIYSDKELTQEVGISSAALDILRDDKYDTNDEVKYAVVEYEGNTCYVSKDECSNYVLRYRETDFDDVEEGSVTYYEIGDYNTIDRVALSENGILTVFNKSKAPQSLQQAIRWIDTEHTQGIDIDEDGTVHVHYNTLDENGSYEHQDYPKVLDWIQSVVLSQDGTFKVIYNNDTVTEDIDEETGHSQYQTTVEWIDKITVAEDGIINFFYNTDHENPIYSTSGANRIKSIKKIEYDKGTNETDGTHKFVITYNTLDEEGHNEVEDTTNWPGINYIVEARISTPTVEYPEAPYSHLLVLYSDPVYRRQFQNKWVDYPSEKLGGQVFKEWVDMGNVRGEKGGMQVVASFTDEALLYDDSENHIPIPPEYLIYAKYIRSSGESYIFNSDQGKDVTYAGWFAAVKLNADTQGFYFYDYSTAEWITVGTIDQDLISPESLLLVSYPATGTDAPPTETDTLRDKGIWFAMKSHYCVE